MANYIIIPFVSLSSPFCIPLGFLLCFSKCHVLFAFGSSFSRKIILGYCCSSRLSADCPAIRRSSAAGSLVPVGRFPLWQAMKSRFCYWQAMQVYSHFAKSSLQGLPLSPLSCVCTAAPFNGLKCFFVAAALAVAGVLCCPPVFCSSHGKNGLLFCSLRPFPGFGNINPYPTIKTALRGFLRLWRRFIGKAL